jgi:hypothetical protein
MQLMHLGDINRHVKPIDRQEWKVATIKLIGYLVQTLFYLVYTVHESLCQSHSTA